MDFITHATAVSASVVLLVQQLLKFNFVPVAFANNHPVPTNIILSIIATLLIVPLNLDPQNLGDIAVQVLTVSVTSALAYNQLLSKWTALKDAEGTGKTR